MSGSTASSSPEFLAASTAGTVHAVMWVAASLSTLIVALRCYVRLSIKSAFGLDDMVALAATGFLIAYAAVTTAATSKGLGRHIEYVETLPNGTQDLIEVALLADIAEALAIMSCTLGKTSFAVTLYRIVIQPWIKGVLWFIIITMNVVNVLAALFVFVQCKDPRHLWNPSIPSECWPTHVFTYFSLFVGSYSGAQDFVLAILPWVVVLRLNMGMREKLAVTLAMSLGVFAGATAIVKATYLPNLSKKTDYTWALPPLLWWAAAEDGLTIVACSIPVLRPLLGKVKKFSSGGRTKQTSYPLGSVGRTDDVMVVRPDQGRSGAVVETQGSKDMYNIYDDGSDKSILERHSKDGRRSERHNDHGSRIVTTREVAVTYGSNTD